MHMTAHPDDENNACWPLRAHVGMRVALVSATRGDGGQNEIGTELFDALGVLRTEELLTAHRFDGAEQYFTRAVDFGYSFSPEETLEKWGRQEILGDFVRHIRTLRPDVIVTLGVDGTGGGQHHQTSAVIATEAFQAAADPAQFPEQIKAGLRPWQAQKLYRPAGGFGGRGRGGPAALAARRAGRAQARPGRTSAGGAPPRQAPLRRGPADPYAHFAHRHQRLRAAARLHDRRSGRRRLGHAHVPGTRADGAAAGPLRARATAWSRPCSPSQRDKDETSLFEGIDTSLMGLARFAGARQSDALVRGLAIASAHVAAAHRRRSASAGPAAAVQPLVYGLSAIRELRSNLPGAVADESGRYEIDFRLAQKEEQFQEALVLAQSLRIEATANDGLIVPGQPLSVTVTIGNRGAGELPMRTITLVGFDGQSGVRRAGGRAARAVHAARRRRPCPRTRG